MRFAPTRLQPWLLLAFLIATLAGGAAGQQRVVGTVVSGDYGEPIEGAMVVLLSDGRRVTGALSAADGSYRIHVPRPGLYRLRIDRIGYVSSVSAVFEVAAGETVTQRIETEVQAINLKGLEALGVRRCELSTDDGTATLTAWEEARKALAAAAWTSDRGVYRLAWVRYARDLGVRGERVLNETRVRRRTYTADPFRSIEPGLLEQHGYVREDGGDLVYAAPDAKVLLSDLFLDRHCVSLVRGQGLQEGLIGLHFEPIDGVRLPDVEGVIWLDQETGRLTSVEYEYVNMGRRAPIEGDEASGWLKFHELPNGTWIIEDWQIRMPLLNEHRDRLGRTLRYEVQGYVEEGGTVTEVATRAGTVLRGSETGIHGTVTDSLGIPAADVRVWIAGTALATRTDSEGVFTFTEVIPGSWSVRASHPALEAFGHVGVDAQIQVADDELRPVQLGLPSIRSIVSERCSDTANAEEPTAILAGRVFNPNGSPAEDVIVRSTWARGTGYEGFATSSDRLGVFTFCSVPMDKTLTTTALTTDSTASTAPMDVEVPEADGFSLVELELEQIEMPERAAEQTAARGTQMGQSGETAVWLRSVGFDLREAQALAHYSNSELRTYDGIPQALGDTPRLDVRTASSGRVTTHIRAAQEVGTDGTSPTCEIDDHYLNGQLVRQRIGTIWEAQIIRRFEPRAVSGLEAFEGHAAPVGPPDACGVVLFWVSDVRSADDPDFRGRLVGRIEGPDDAALGGIEIRVLPGLHEATTDENGGFDFGLLPPASYLLDITMPGWGNWQHRVAVRAYSESSVLIEVTRLDGVEGTPR